MYAFFQHLSRVTSLFLSSLNVFTGKFWLRDMMHSHAMGLAFTLATPANDSFVGLLREVP